MKYLEKFKINESLSDSSPVSWTKEKFAKINKMKEEIENNESKLLPFLHEFLEINPELLDSDMSKDEFYVQTYYYYPENPFVKFSIKYLDGDNEEYFASLNDNKFEELLQFLKDPETYVNSKKYNI